jgi:uncharacterized protein
MEEYVNIQNKKCFELLNNKEERKAFECFLENSKTGDSTANYMVAEMYLHGSGVDTDEKKAFEYYLKSDDPLALYRLGQINYQGWGCEINYPASINWFTKAEKRGVVEANYYLGCIYYYGYGLEKNIGSALESLEKVANSGEESEFLNKERHKEYVSFAQGLLGEIYSESENFPDSDKDEIHSKSGYWYFESARNGNERSKVLTIFGGRFFPTAGGDSCANQNVHFKNFELLDFSESITKKYQDQSNEFYDLAIKSAKELLADDIKKSSEGDPESEYWMAQRYENGLMVEKDLKQSFRYVKSAAEKGYTYAQAMLGIYLLEGTGTSVDIGQSIKYLQHAQEKDDFFSYELARAYEAESPYQNLKKAYELFFACKANWKIGLYNELELIELSSLLNAKEAYEKASQNGVVDAKVRLAVWKFLGIETIEDIESASKELFTFWDRVDIKELLMIKYYEKVFTETLDKSGHLPSNEIASSSLACAQQCLRAYPHFNVKNNYGSEVRNRILLRGVNWYIKSFNLQGYSAIENFYKKEFINLISTEAKGLIEFHNAGLITTKTLYIFARQFRLAELESLAIPIYEKLANLGFGVPQYILGMSYAHGVFKPQNYLKSHAWLNLAYSNGIEIALQSREKIANQITQSEIILSQKLAEEIQLSIDSLKNSLGLHDEIREIDEAELDDINSSYATKFRSLFSEKEEGLKPTRSRVRKPFKEASFAPPLFTPNKDSITEKKPAYNSIFGTIIKVLLFLPFAALFAWLIYIFGAIALVWIFVKMAI